jgi:PAS domain S-box-containing protein
MVALLGVLLLSGRGTTAQSDAKNVLVVFDSSERNHRQLDRMESALRTTSAQQVNFYIIHLDYERTEDRPYLDSTAEAIRSHFNETKPDVVLAFSIHSLRFAMQYRDRTFPGVPIIFAGVTASELEGLKMLPGMTGVIHSVGLRETIDLALRLHPDTTEVVLVVDAPGQAERYWVQATQTELLRHRDKLKEVDIIGPPSHQMLDRISALPAQKTIALWELAPQSGSEPEVGAFDVLAATARHLPTYSPWDSICLGYGCIGGAFTDGDKLYALAGELAGRVLKGERPEDIPLVERPTLQVRLDWRALQRWHIPESALPPGTLVLYRQPTFWERDRNYILAATALILLQALAIAGLLWQRARKRRAEAVLRESEERFRVMADTTPALIWMCDSHGKITYLNERWLAFTGREPWAGYGDSWTAYVHPDDVKNLLDALWQALKERSPFAKEYRLRRSDGVYRWMFDVASPRVNGDGSFAGFIGSAIDVTDQKLAQQALENVSGQLIEAQEKERTRIARDLHDDVCQRLALLSMELEQAKRDSSGRISATKNLEEIRKHCSEIAGDVQSLSHQLHSSKLDYLGVAAAIRGFCKEFSKQHKVNVEFDDSNVPPHLPKDVSLCLFRVAQEALYNAAKYSGVNQFAVELSTTLNEVQLQVSDAGTGFDVEEARKNRGLGLVSMQERVHLVHGQFSIESKPGVGTRIRAVVPLGAENGLTSKSMEATLRR